MSQASNQNTTQHPTKFYRLPQVKAYLGVSGSTIWNWIKQGTFPRQIKLSPNVSVWSVADVEAWAQSRIEASQQGEG